MAARAPNPNTPPPVKSDFLALARYLRQLHDRNPDGFFQDAERIGVKRRKAYYLLQIEATIDRLPASDDRLRKIGWTKLMHLTRIIEREGDLPPGGYEELLRTAETQPVQALREMAEGKTPSNRRGMLFFLTPEEQEMVNEALLRHGAVKTPYGLRDKEAALLRALGCLPPE